VQCAIVDDFRKERKNAGGKGRKKVEKRYELECCLDDAIVKCTECVILHVEGSPSPKVTMSLFNRTMVLCFVDPTRRPALTTKREKMRNERK
jgi:hypothetical protein